MSNMFIKITLRTAALLSLLTLSHTATAVTTSFGVSLEVDDSIGVYSERTDTIALTKTSPESTDLAMDEFKIYVGVTTNQSIYADFSGLSLTANNDPTFSIPLQVFVEGPENISYYSDNSTFQYQPQASNLLLSDRDLNNVSPSLHTFYITLKRLSTFDLVPNWPAGSYSGNVTITFRHGT